MELFVSNLIRNVSGKNLSYESTLNPSKSEIWFMNVIFDDKKYRVISFNEDGVVCFYKKHPIDQKEIPTHKISFFVC